MRIITWDDFIEVYTKTKQRGFSFFISKLNINSVERTRSAFNESNINSANWSIIPKLKERWNTIITGSPKIEYQTFVVERFLKNSNNLKLLSIGSGKCIHEFKFASYSNFEEILCIDISENLINEAKKVAKINSYNNIRFEVQNLYNYEIPENSFDIILFHASLHHFKNIDYLLGTKLKKTLKKNGLLIINEYVGPNRIQYPKHQIEYINRALRIIPKKFRQRFKLSLYKNKIYGSGLLRMIIADPSECINSESILPTIHKYYDTKHEVNLGGNLLMPVLKDISHHFLETTKEKEDVLNKLFKAEDEYLKSHPSNYIFGIYVNNK
jgi:ubiquinone/menaquinone biosynthesis C-methylase UbiE